MRKKEISMIILAGGASSRMGRDKSERKGAVFAFLKRIGYECYESSADDWYFSNINNSDTYVKIVKDYYSNPRKYIIYEDCYRDITCRKNVIYVGGRTNGKI